VINEIFQIDEVMSILQQAGAWLIRQTWVFFLVVVVAVVAFAVLGARSPAQKNLDRHDPFSGGW